ncbi:MAG: hypothetical protein ACTSRU_00745 [Candidatus Hodarchaeales archaeon]
MLFIEVKKVVEKKKRSKDGSKVINPEAGSEVSEGELESLKEAIEIATIKSWRHWRKSPKENLSIEGKMTMIYFKKNPELGEKNPTMLIEESSESFTRRMPAIPLEGE